MIAENNTATLSDSAKKILIDGEILKKNEELALQIGNGYNFTRRIFQEISLIIAGQLIKWINSTDVLRGYSHAGIYASPGLGKDYAWTLAENSNIFPFDLLRASRVDNLTTATLYGTISAGGWIVPPVTITNDIIFVGEYSTLLRGNEQANLAADLRVFQETGHYSRRLAMLMELKTELENPHKKAIIENELQRLKAQGLTIDLEKSELTVNSTTSWMINSARFGTQTSFGRPLLAMGDIDRLRWRSYLPDVDERRKIVLDVGSFPSVSIDIATAKALNEAWKYLAKFYKNNNIGISIPFDEASHQKRKEVWIATQKEIEEKYGQLEDKYTEQLVNLRSSSEFHRIMYQYAALKQFQRCQGYDFSIPDKFVIDYKEDGDFARKLWVEEYVPSLIDVVNDVLKLDHRGSMKGPKLKEIAIRKILDILGNGPMSFEDIHSSFQEAEQISQPYLYKLLRKLVDEGSISRKDGFYESVQAHQPVSGGEKE
ncbi:MAG: winged helix-turn-helix domain-containing protein [Candidatus Methanomethylicaceae archaeon]